MSNLEKTIARAFLEMADGLETGSFGPRPKIALTGMGSEHGEENAMAAAQMAAGAGARNGEIQHLAGKDEGSQHAHERDEPHFFFLPDLTCAERCNCSGSRPHGAAYRR